MSIDPPPPGAPLAGRTLHPLAESLGSAASIAHWPALVQLFGLTQSSTLLHVCLHMPSAWHLNGMQSLVFPLVPIVV
jgi:hypothetical protein